MESNSSSNTDTNSTFLFTESDMISMYSRSDAMADGLLIDISAPAHQAGVKVPAAVTQALDAVLTAFPDDAAYIPTDYHALLVMCRAFVRATRAEGGEQDRITFTVKRVWFDGDDEPNEVWDFMRIKAVIGAGDTPEPVITFMLVDED